MQIRKLCCTCMRAQAVSRLIFLKIYVNCILQCTGNLVAALYLQMWEGSQISIDKSKPKRCVSVLVCSTARSGKSFKGLGLGSAHLKSKTLKSERIRGRSKRKGSWKKIEILNQELNFSTLLLPVRRSVVRARGEKKKSCWSLFMVILITTVLSPRAASFPSASASFHFVSVLHEDPVALVVYVCFLPQLQLLVWGRANGWGHAASADADGASWTSSCRKQNVSPRRNH